MMKATEAEFAEFLDQVLRRDPEAKPAKPHQVRHAERYRWMGKEQGEC